MLDRKRKIVFAVSVAAVLFFAAGNFVATKMDSKTPFRPLSIFGEVISYVSTDYVEDVDERKAMRGAFAGFMEGLDPMCDFIEKEEIPRYDSVLAQARTHPVAVTRRYGYAYVMQVLPGSTADQDGLKRGDYIRAIDHKSTREMSLFQIRDALVSQHTSELMVVRDNWRADPILITLHPAAARPGPSAKVARRDGTTIVTVTRLRSGASGVLRTALLEMKAAGALNSGRLVLDLRGCVGDDYDEAVRLIARLVGDGDLASRRGRAAKPDSYKADPAAYIGTPRCVLLVDGFTCGAAEIVAASLKSRGLAKIFGDKTYGYTREQRLYLLSDGSGAVLSTYEWTPPDGSTITGKGVDPDVPREPKPDAELPDPLLDDAIRYLLVE
ncbi:MAG: S41 family peptidase [Acidobacteriota bacterium]